MGHKNEYSVFAFDNVDNSGLPLSSTYFFLESSAIWSAVHLTLTTCDKNLSSHGTFI